MDDDISALARMATDLRAIGQRLLAAADQSRPGEKALHARLADALGNMSLLGRTHHGVFVQLLGRAQEHRAMPGGAPAWLATNQGVSIGHARTLVSDAKHLTTDPLITGHLTEGALSPDATRVLARTLKALSDTDTDTQRHAVAEVISEIQTKGVTQAAKLIPQLKKKASPRAAEEILAEQRARSYARVIELDDGAHRYQILLDAERSERVNAALADYAAHVYRRRQCGDVEALPAHVHTTEQVAAHAFACLAEGFLSAGESQPEAASEPSAMPAATLETANRPTDTVHGEPRSAPALPEDDRSRADTARRETGEKPGTFADKPTGSRGLRRLTESLKRPCTSPGCTGSAVWPVHAHYAKRIRRGGLSELRDLILYCPDHAVIDQTG